MSYFEKLSVERHTTSSHPSLHILYVIQVTLATGIQYEVLRRYSEFIELKNRLGDPFMLPPRHSMAIALVPWTWAADHLIAERKIGLTSYLDNLLVSGFYNTDPAFLAFLDPTVSGFSGTQQEMVSKSVLTTSGAIHLARSMASPIVATYYPVWSARNRPPSQPDFSKFDILFFAFVVPNSSATISWDSGSQKTLKQLVSAARSSGKKTKIVLSVGGWAGSYWFSHIAGSAANRSKFTNALVSAVNTYGLDGIDLDWEYPNSSGNGNPYSYKDAENFLLLLKSLRSALGTSKIISAAVTHLPWLGSNGKSLTNVSAYAAQLTYINIMNYDVNGASSTPGANAPLGNQCGTSSRPQANAKAALAQWTKAGMPASKILLGLPLYGYVSQSTAKKLYGTGVSNPSEISHAGSNVSTEAAEPDSTNRPGDLSAWWGAQIPFHQILGAGALKKQADGTYAGANGYTMGWDNCSETPFLYNTAKRTFVSFDETRSLALKAKFARASGMAGCFTWSLDQDDGYTLQNIIRASLK